jgi:hypothetical protein
VATGHAVHPYHTMPPRACRKGGANPGTKFTPYISKNKIKTATGSPSAENEARKPTARASHMSRINPIDSTRYYSVASVDVRWRHFPQAATSPRCVCRSAYDAMPACMFVSPRANDGERDSPWPNSKSVDPAQALRAGWEAQNKHTRPDSHKHPTRAAEEMQRRTRARASQPSCVQHEMLCCPLVCLAGSGATRWLPSRRRCRRPPACSADCVPIHISRATWQARVRLVP